VESLIINAVDSEPFTLPGRILLSGRIAEFIRGADILRRALSDEARVYMGIDCRERELAGQIESAAKWLYIQPLKPKYPQSHEALLARNILGRNIPYGGSICDLNAVVLDVQAVFHAYEAVIEGKPVIERVVALGGSGLRENIYAKVRVGTPLDQILPPLMKSTEVRCIYGGVITGSECRDLSIPVDRTTCSIAVLEERRERQFLSFLRPGIHRDSFSNAFLSSPFPKAMRNVDTNEKGEHRPCIYCNYCEEVCPAGLMPYLLSKYVTHDMMEEAARHKILDCIDCGLCTYVCPCKIPVMSHIQKGKEMVRDDRHSMK
jgi:Na(+)-translocating NADH:ubiquinone oxidoreductase A subunit